MRRRGEKRRSGFAALGVLLALAGSVVAKPAKGPPIDFRLSGGDKALLASLKGASLMVSTEASGDSQAQDLFAAARADYQRLIAALYGAGYYAPVIHILVDGREAASVAPLDAPSAIGAITVTVDPGPLYHFSTAAVGPLAAGTKLPEGFRPDAVAASGAIQAAADAAVQGWRDAGHAKAKPAGQKIVADARTDTLAAEIAISPGPEVTLGQMTISGESQVRRERIAAIAGFPAGTAYTPKKVETSADRLRRTGAFASVALTESDKLGPGDTMDVNAAVVDAKKRRLGFGGEISSSQGASLSAFWLHRNLLGGAEQFKLEGEIDGIGGQTGGLSYKLSARLDRPATFNPDTALYLLGSVERENLTDYDADILSLGAGLTRIVNDRLTLRYGVGFEAERVTDVTGTTSYRDVNLPLGATWDSRDNKLDAHRGLYLDAGIMPFAGLGETGSGAKLSFDARTYRPIGNSLVLAARLQGGSILGASIASTPRDYLFYSGGGGTVRGQPYQSLGVYAISPTLHSGGRSFLAVSGELRSKLSPSIGLVAFYDAGFVGAGSLGGHGAWQAGAGLGLRYFTAIGPIRLDAAMPVSGATGKGLQLYIGIGQAF